MQHAAKQESVLDVFCHVRNALLNSQFNESARHILGTLDLTDGLLAAAQRLIDEDQAEVRYSNKPISYLNDVVGQRVEITLKIVQLQYYEGTNDLVKFTSREPDRYFVSGVGMVAKGDESLVSAIVAYRDILRARDFLRSVADYDDQSKITILVPERLEVQMACRSLSFEPLLNLAQLSTHFAQNPDADSAEREQRLVLFRRVLKEYLKTYPADQRLYVFAANFGFIYESYTRDYQLWTGNSFGELEKAFEEKRLKFIADLNGILSGVQTSILAVPIATIILGDKFDFTTPTKNFFLATAVSVMGAVALRLLDNQQATLDATRKAIDATKLDFEKKHNKRKQEFTTRLQNLDDQESRVRNLLKSLQAIIWSIVILSFGAWLASAFWPLFKSCLSSKAPVTLPAPVESTSSVTAPKEAESFRDNKDKPVIVPVVNSNGPPSDLED